jgi:hypothetical protein
MEKRSIVKKVAAVFTGSSSPALGSEMPETPGLKLPEGKSLPRRENGYCRLSWDENRRKSWSRIPFDVAVGGR